ncbi:MAG: helix-turn-helix transcriptional regulator, partial [Deltaproteobacteria bacterium]|nr:helix-turn-helix transcriptional regulator [Deltaproteobacteria bacterium]
FCLALTDRKLTRQATAEPTDLPEDGFTFLKDLKAALRTVLKLREEEKKDFEDRLKSNVRRLILPHLERLKASRLDKDQLTSLNMIESHLHNITSTFAQTTFSKYYQLTPREIQVADMIKSGRTSKEIADLLHVSRGSVEFHRNNIRKKLGLDNMKTNLRSYLLSMDRC